MPHSVVQVRIDAELKKRAQATLQTQGLRMNDAIRLFLTETVRLGRLPFDTQDAPMRAVSQKRLWAIKRAQQVRDRAAIASGAIKPESVLLIRPSRIKGAKVVWPGPDVPLSDKRVAAKDKQSQQSRERPRRNVKRQPKRKR